jgi:MFS transporter, NNP family, nitrate/nitrite transporter
MEKECPIPESFKAMAGTVLFITGLFLLNFLGRFILAPIMPFLVLEWRITHTEAGALFLIISSGFALAQFSSGFVSSRLDHRKALILSGVAVGVALLGLGLAHSLWAIRLVLIVLGLAAGLHIPSALATITATVRRQDWGKALGVHSSAPTLGLVLGPLLVATVGGLMSWRSIIFFLGISSILVSMAFLVFGRGGDFPGYAPRPSLLNQIIRIPSFWLMTLLFVMALGGSVGIFTVLPLYLITEQGMDKMFANTVIGLAQISGFLAAFGGGWLADRVGPKPAMSALLVAGGAANILLGISSDRWLLIVLFIQPALVGSLFPAAFSALSRIVHPNLRSVAASVTIPVAFLTGVGLFPAIYGYLGQTHSFGLGIVLAGCFMLLGPLFAFALKLIEHEQEGC